MSSDCSELDLDFSSGNEGQIPNFLYQYTLPSCSFPHPSLTDLKLTKCEFIPSLYGSFHSVRNVVLIRVALPNLLLSRAENSSYSFHDMLSRCPRLEELHLIECEIPYNIQLHEQESNIKCLAFERCFGGGGYIFSVDINILSLLRFKFLGMPGNQFTVSNSENLVEAEFDLLIDDKQHMLLFKLLNDLRRVKISTLSSRCFEEDLDELIFSVSDFNVETFWESHLIPSGYVSNLKRVEIKGFLGRRNQIEFVKAVLKNSIWLKKMVIFCKPRTRSTDVLVMLDLLVPKAAPNAQVLLKQEDFELVV